MKGASKATTRTLVNQSIILEQQNAEILRKNLAAARKAAIKQNTFGSPQFRQTLTSVLDVFINKSKANFKLTGAIQMGLNHGHALAAEMLTGGDPSKAPHFLAWRPVLPLAAISAKESEFATLIAKLASESKELILRKIQQGLALGMSTQDLQDQVLGTGLKGLMGRDGVWRKATQRAETIARTVSNDLINYGAQITYLEMERITPEAGFTKVWQTVSDNRTSDRCKSLLGQRQPLSGYFVANDGWSGQRPPSHPNCRSRITLVATRYEAKWDIRYRDNPGF